MSNRPISPEVAPRIALPWIVRLRYALAIGQIATILAVSLLLEIDLPLDWILIPPAITGLSNLWLSRWSTAPEALSENQVSWPAVGTAHVLAWMFALDTLCLTAVLMLSGGPNNPFSLLYLVAITLSATILTKWQTWALGALATLCFALLFWIYRPIPQLEMHNMNGGMNLHLTGMWVGFGVAAFLVAMFSGKISELLREREESLIRMQAELAKKDRLASLVTLAAGAAHELATPLATIAVVAKELERNAAQADTPARNGNLATAPSLLEDSRLIRTEVERCRAILARMSAQGAEPLGEMPEQIQVSAFMDRVAAACRNICDVRIEVPAGTDKAAVMAPPLALEQALIALVKNAADAGRPGLPVTLSARVEDHGMLAIQVIDQGSGMSAETLRHVGEPFFTTKETGKGMGLGVFLVRTLADRLGGSLDFASPAEGGTAATFKLPLAQGHKSSKQPSVPV